MRESPSVVASGEPRIGKQIRLPWRKAVEIAAKSVRVRFWRSMITMSSIVLAIAFLMSIWTSTAITAALTVGPQREIESIKERLLEVRRTAEGAPNALAGPALLQKHAGDLRRAIARTERAIRDKREAMEDAGTDERKKLQTEIDDLRGKLQPEQHVALLLEYLKATRGEVEQTKGRVDTILQQERGSTGAEAAPGGAAAEAEVTSESARAAVASSLTNFISQMSPTDTWLAILALLVCLVGIANAMFMTVQERFREIGTMKCLGALDGFIVKIFLIESASLGLIGTLLGVVAGLILSTVRQLLVYGWPVTDYFPPGTVFVAAVLASVIGLILSVGAAIWPAQKAARMEPVEAMRVEE